MTDYENLENIEACGECGTFHDHNFCPEMERIMRDDADPMEEMKEGYKHWDDQPFCEQHPDTTPTMVRGVEGDDIGYECPTCKACCTYHRDTLYEDLGRRDRDGAVLKQCPKCVEETKTHGGGLSMSEQARRYDDYWRGL